MDTIFFYIYFLYGRTYFEHTTKNAQIFNDILSTLKYECTRKSSYLFWQFAIYLIAP